VKIASRSYYLVRLKNLRHVTSTDTSRSNPGSKPSEVKLAPHTQRGSSGPHFPDTSSQSSHALWPDDEAAQPTGPSELQATEVFATAGHLSLSPALKLRHHGCQFLRAHVTRGDVQGRFMPKCLLGRTKPGFGCLRWMSPTWPGLERSRWRP
jgi:hypothetical protein